MASASENGLIVEPSSNRPRTAAPANSTHPHAASPADLETRVCGALSRTTVTCAPVLGMATGPKPGSRQAKTADDAPESGNKPRGEEKNTPEGETLEWIDLG